MSFGWISYIPRLCWVPRFHKWKLGRSCKSVDSYHNNRRLSIEINSWAYVMQMVYPQSMHVKYTSRQRKQIIVKSETRGNCLWNWDRYEYNEKYFGWCRWVGYHSSTSSNNPSPIYPRFLARYAKQCNRNTADKNVNVYIACLFEPRGMQSTWGLCV